MDVSAHHETKNSQRNILFFPLLLPLKQCFQKKINYDISHMAFQPFAGKGKSWAIQDLLRSQLGAGMVPWSWRQTQRRLPATCNFTWTWNRDFKGRIYSDHFIIYSGAGIGMITNSNSLPHLGKVQGKRVPLPRGNIKQHPALISQRAFLIGILQALRVLFVVIYVVFWEKYTQIIAQL